MGFGEAMRRGRDSAVMAERLQHLRRQMGLVICASLFGGPSVAAVLAPATGIGFAVFWASAVVLLGLFRGLWVLAQGRSRAPRRIAAQVRGHIAWATLNGLLWGLVGHVALQAGRSDISVETFLLLSAMVAGGIGSLSALPAAHAGFAVPAFLPMTLFFLRTDQPQWHVYGVAAVVFLCVMLAYSVNFSRILVRTIELRFEKDALIRRLEEARARAERENELKSRFLQSASHDLRQPLQAVCLLLDELAAQLPAGGRARLGQCQATVCSLALFLDRLLEASRVGDGTLTPILEHLPLARLFEALEFEYAPAARARGLRLSIRPTRRAVHSDEVMLLQILRNYLANAVRHARQLVVLGVRRERDGLRIEVWDDGPGIAAGQQQAIFEPFYQIGNAARDPSRGFGLGLAIVSSMARLLGIERGVRSRPGRFTVFHVRLRTAPVAEKGDCGQVAEEAEEAGCARG